MNRKIVRQIARENGVSVKEVRADMQAAVDHAYSQPNLNYLARGAISKIGKTPTVDEFVAHAASEAKKRMEKSN